MQGYARPQDSFLGAILASPVVTTNDEQFTKTAKATAMVKRTHFPQLSTDVGKTLPLLLPKLGGLGYQKVGSRAISLSSPRLLAETPTFEAACADPKFTINPAFLGFVPHDAWKDEPMPFGMLVMSFFRKRNSMHCKFPFKLYNALRLTDKLPSFFRYVGIRWITETVFMVDKHVFAKLLGVRTIDGSLFHQQGNFPSHGFVELNYLEAAEVAASGGLGEMDLSTVRLLKHGTGGFTRHCSETDLHQIKWIHG